MATHRSAMGKEIDMGALRQKNEKTRAVGNMNVNSRGDVIDSKGQVINDNNKRVNEYYMKSVINRGIKPTSTAPKREARKSGPSTPTMPKVDETSQIPVVPEMTKEEMEFEVDLPEDIKNLKMALEQKAE